MRASTGRLPQRAGVRYRRLMRSRLRASGSDAALLVLASLPFHLAAGAAAQTGFATEYPGDVRIAEDRRVVLAEDFESGAVADLSRRWSDVKNAEGMSFVGDVPAASTGKRALEITSLGGANGGGHLYAALPSGQKRVYLRYYVQYAEGGSYHHSGGWLGGYQPKSAWPQGGAGERPAGNERFTVGFEPVDAALRLDFYAYWMGMRPDGGGAHWGNTLLGDPALRVRPGAWTCIEILLQLNEPTERENGELAAWVDGVRVGHLGPGSPSGTWSGGRFQPDAAGTPFPGFRWRSDPALELNFVWLQHYTTGDPAGHVGRLRFDHVVVATDYIGPIAVR